MNQDKKSMLFFVDICRYLRWPLFSVHFKFWFFWRSYSFYLDEKNLANNKLMIIKESIWGLYVDYNPLYSKDLWGYRFFLIHSKDLFELFNLIEEIIFFCFVKCLDFSVIHIGGCTQWVITLIFPLILFRRTV